MVYSTRPSFLPCLLRVADRQVEGSHPHSLSPLKNGCTFVMGWLGTVSRGGCREQTAIPVIAPLLPRALCQAGIVSSCVSWLSRIPIGSGKAGLVLPAAGGLGTHWDGGERRRSWQQLEILALLANQIPLSRFKDQIGFIQRCINQAASHLTNRKALQGAIKNRRLL